jgi:TonB family protein
MTHFSFQVDRQAEFIFDSTVSVAPSSRKSGGVAVQFVVDQRGQPELGSFKILRSPDEAAAERARNAFPRWRFTPALRDGCPVRQLVQVEVVVAARYQGEL